MARFTKYLRLQRTMARIIRLFKNGKQESKNQFKGEFQVSELEAAEFILIKQCQQDCFSAEINALQKSNNLSNSRIQNLSPYLDDNNIIRLKGRTQNSKEIDDYAKNPAILDSKHVFTKLLITSYHEKVGHHGQELVMNELRQKYWIIGLRKAVKSAWNDCNTCKILRAKPSPPEMGLLPDCRVTKQIRPFMETGVDFFGPIYVTVGRRHEKRYGVLFTCLTVRAIHLEITSSLSTDATIMALRRFIARRGQPKVIYSDNGTNFKGADKELKQILSQLNNNEITRILSNKGIIWKFIPPLTPHMGGSWERLIRSVKTTLNVVLKEKFPREETMSTIFAEIEHIINNHPLTHVSIDPDDPECLTPNHFLIGKPTNTSILNHSSDEDICLRKQWRIAQRYADIYWKRWIKEYLPTLTRKTKWFKTSKPIEINDIVLIVDETLPRNNWPKGIIVAVYPGKDGIVRVADVKTTSGIFKRSVVKLCLLDINRKNEN